MATPTFGGLHIFVRDMGASLAFYRMLGFQFPEGSENEVFAQAELAPGISLALGTYGLTREYDSGFQEPSGPSPSAFQVDVESRAAVDAIFQQLVSAGHQPHLAPFDAFWGSRYAEVHDPDGNLIGFQSPRAQRPA